MTDSPIPITRQQKKKKKARTDLITCVEALSTKEWEGLRYDKMTDTVRIYSRTPICPPDETYPRQRQDIDDLRIRAYLERWRGLSPSTTLAHEAATASAHARAFHPLRNYLRGLEWDGTERIGSWLPMYLGAPDDAYTRAVGRCWLISAAARALRPGCKVDTTLILEGAQGEGKSTAVASLVPDQSWFTDDLGHLGTKDAAHQLQGRWLIEFAELDAINRSEVSGLKAFLTRQVDKFRPSYGRSVIEFPRSCVFVGSVNSAEYLRDETGNRRFWPVTVADIDLISLADSRDQLWAEAVAAFEAGETWVLDAALWPAAHAKTISRMEEDTWTVDVLEAAQAIVRQQRQAGEEQCDAVRMSQVLERIGIELARQERKHQLRAGAILRSGGWERSVIRVKGISAKVWREPLTWDEDPTDSIQDYT